MGDVELHMERNQRPLPHMGYDPLWEPPLDFTALGTPNSGMTSDASYINGGGRISTDPKAYAMPSTPSQNGSHNGRSLRDGSLPRYGNTYGNAHPNPGILKPPQTTPLTPSSAAHRQFQTHPSTPRHRLNPLDQILPRNLTYLIVDLYFKYIYCLIPCLHKPSFYRDLQDRREEQPGQEEWTALVLAVVASTLAQVPRSFVPLPNNEIKPLVLVCQEWVKRWQFQDFKQATVTRSRCDSDLRGKNSPMSCTADTQAPLSHYQLFVRKLVAHCHHPTQELTEPPGPDSQVACSASL